MITYYKATRPDGTDFRTGTVRYELGATVKHPASRKFSDMRPNDPGTYLSVSVEPGEALVGGSWPCRVFRVEPVGRVVRRTDGQLPHKRGCREMGVVEELPAHTAFGPNGEAVAALLERAGRLTYDEATALHAARDAAWDAAWGATAGAARGAAAGAARGAAWDAAWGAARGAAWDAAWALLVRDLISEEHFDVLYGPWASVIGVADAD